METLEQQQIHHRRGRPALATPERIAEAIKQALAQKGSFTHTEIHAAVGGSMTSVNRGIRQFLDTNPSVIQKNFALSEKFMKIITQEIAGHLEELLAEKTAQINQANYDLTLLSEALEQAEENAGEVNAQLQEQLSKGVEQKVQIGLSCERLLLQEEKIARLQDELHSAKERLKDFERTLAELSDSRQISNRYLEEIIGLKHELAAIRSTTPSEKLPKQRCPPALAHAEKYPNCILPIQKVVEGVSDGVQIKRESILNTAIARVRELGPLPTGRIKSELESKGIEIQKLKSLVMTLRRSGVLYFDHEISCWCLPDPLAKPSDIQ